MITKKQFINTLKNPHNQLIRRKIKEFRKLIYADNPDWKITSRYFKSDQVFKVYIRCSPPGTINEYSEKLSRHTNDIFPRPEFIISYELTVPFNSKSTQLTMLIYDD